jgi:hypothetical protein
MPSTASALTTLLFGLSLLAPVVLLLAGLVPDPRAREYVRRASVARVRSLPMSLTVGSRLGHYDVTALIGEGGMGSVHQARRISA